MTAWADIEAALDGMLSRRWYTNHGPMAQALERRASTVFAVRHAVLAVNPTIGLVMLAEALGLTGQVLCPAAAPGRCFQSLAWAGLEAVPYDAATVVSCIGPQTTAILTMDPEPGIADLAAAYGLTLYTDGASNGLGPAVLQLDAWGDDVGIACITTNDDGLAAALRNIRSSYGAGPLVSVTRTANGRVSEIQAATALLTLG